MSMKPGATTSPVTSTVRDAGSEAAPPAVPDPEVGDAARRAGPVDDGAPGEEKIEHQHHPFGGSGWRKSRAAFSCVILRTCSSGSPWRRRARSSWVSGHG